MVTDEILGIPGRFFTGFGKDHVAQTIPGNPSVIQLNFVDFYSCGYRKLVPSENTEVPIIRETMAVTTMSSLFVAVFALVVSTFRTRDALQTEILALRHQFAVFQNNAPRRLRLHRGDRLLWIVLCRFWSDWRRCLHMVPPDTVLRWHRRAFA